MKVAVVGLGFMGATHIKAWQGVPAAQLAAVVSSDEKKLAGDLSGIQGNLGKGGEAMDFSGIARYRTLEECLRDANVEAVDICAPTNLHEQFTTAALRAGKHVLVEKPMALDGASAERTIQEAERAGRVLMCAQVLRFLPAYRKASEALPSMGRVQSAVFRRECGVPDWSTWLTDRARSGGAVFDLLIHDVDYMIQLFGEPQWVSATGREEMTAAEFGYTDCGGVAIEGGWRSDPLHPWSAGFKIVADGGTLESSADVGDGFAEELGYFIECASKGAYPHRCPPSESALAVRLAGLMVKSKSRDGERLTCSK